MFVGLFHIISCIYCIYLWLSHITILLIDNPQAVGVDIGLAIKPIPVRLIVIELDVVTIITDVSNDFNTVVIVLSFYISFWVCCFCLWSM